MPAAIIGYLLWRIEPQQWQELREQPKNYWLLVAALAGGPGGDGDLVCPLVHAGPLPGHRADDAGGISARGDLFSAQFRLGGECRWRPLQGNFLARRRPGKRVAAVASVLVDRGCGLYALMLLVVGGPVAGQSGRPRRRSVRAWADQACHRRVVRGRDSCAGDTGAGWQASRPLDHPLGSEGGIGAIVAGSARRCGCFTPTRSLSGSRF